VRVRVVGVVCAVAVMLSGCAGSGGEEKPPLTTATSSAVETGVAEVTDEPTESVPVYVPLDEAEVGDVVEVEVPVKPEPSAAMAVNDEAGARAAVRYFYDVINYNFAVPDSGIVLEVASELCDYCTEVNGTAEKLVADGHHAVDGGITLKSIDAIRRLSDVAWIASTTAEYPATVLVDAEGEVQGRKQKSQILEDQMIFIFENGGWKLDDLGERAF